MFTTVRVSGCTKRSHCFFYPFLIFSCSGAFALDLPIENALQKSPEELWSLLILDRQTLTSGECEVHVNVIKIDGGTEARQLEGSSAVYHIWWDNEAFRVDLDEDRPQNQQDANHYRRSYSNGRFRSMPAYQNPNVIAYEIASHSNQTSPLPPHLKQGRWADPRMAGFWPDSFAALERRTFKDLADAVARPPSTSIKPDSTKGKPLIRMTWKYEKNNAKREFYLDPHMSLYPVQVKSSVTLPDGREMVDQINCEWSEVPMAVNNCQIVCLFPTQVTYERLTGNQLVAKEISTVSMLRHAYMPVSDETFGWTGLGLRAGSVVKFIDSAASYNSTWDGNSFQEWKPASLDVVRSTSQSQ